MHFVTCPRQGRELEAVVLHKVGFLAYPCPKQGHDFKPSAAPLYPNMGQVPPPPPPPGDLFEADHKNDETLQNGFYCFTGHRNHQTNCEVTVI